MFHIFGDSSYGTNTQQIMFISGLYEQLQGRFHQPAAADDKYKDI